MNERGQGCLPSWEGQLLNPGPQWAEVILEKNLHTLHVRNDTQFVLVHAIITISLWKAPDIYAKMIYSQLLIESNVGTRNKKKGVYLIVIYIALRYTP